MYNASLLDSWEEGRGIETFQAAINNRPGRQDLYLWPTNMVQTSDTAEHATASVGVLGIPIWDCASHWGSFWKMHVTKKLNGQIIERNRFRDAKYDISWFPCAKSQTLIMITQKTPFGQIPENKDVHWTYMRRINQWKPEATVADHVLD